MLVTVLSPCFRTINAEAGNNAEQEKNASIKQGPIDRGEPWQDAGTNKGVAS